MKSSSRRSFIKKTTTVSFDVISSAALSRNTAFASQLLNNLDRKKNRIRIGIIGAENLHIEGYGKISNIDKKFSGC